jgi:putative nucleotidyltransferase with HDIG domain
MTMNREAAWALVEQWTTSESLRKHMLAVDAAVRGYARLYGEDETGWGIVALLHDFDYQRFPDAEHHPFEGVKVLRELGYPEWVTRAILSHADYSGVPRDSLLEKTLFACDELAGVVRESRLERVLYACDEMAGFVTAAALVRPSKSVLDLEASSVLKRMKDKAFAKAVSRDDLRRGAEELGLPLAEHVGNVIRFLRGEADALGLRGSL